MTAEKDIFIVLSDTGTVFTRLIKLFTKAPYNHTSMAFDRNLREVYSFGRKNVNNPIIAGLVKEDFYNAFFTRSQCAIYRCKVSNRDYRLMHDYINGMMKNQDRYRYNLIGLFGVLMKKRIKRHYAYFCSQFVAYIFEQSSFQPVDKPSCFVKPEDFAKSPYLEEVYRGKLYNYLYDDMTGNSYPVFAFMQDAK